MPLFSIISEVFELMFLLIYLFQQMHYLLKPFGQLWPVCYFHPGWKSRFCHWVHWCTMKLFHAHFIKLIVRNLFFSWDVFQCCGTHQDWIWEIQVLFMGALIYWERSTIVLNVLETGEMIALTKSMMSLLEEQKVCCHNTLIDLLVDTYGAW